MIRLSRMAQAMNTKSLSQNLQSEAPRHLARDARLTVGRDRPSDAFHECRKEPHASREERTLFGRKLHTGRAPTGGLADHPPPTCDKLTRAQAGREREGGVARGVTARCDQKSERPWALEQNRPQGTNVEPRKTCLARRSFDQFRIARRHGARVPPYLAPHGPRSAEFSGPSSEKSSRCFSEEIGVLIPRILEVRKLLFSRRVTSIYETRFTP